MFRNYLRGLALTITVATTLVGLGCKLTSKQAAVKSQPVTLKFWSVFDDEDAYAQIFAAYRSNHPNVNIEYRKLLIADYQKTVLEALAADQGPDLLSIHNSWMNAWQPRLLGSPAVLNVAEKQLQGTIKKDLVTVVVQTPGVTPKFIKDNFVPTVYDSAVMNQISADPKVPATPRVYGLPLTVDSLALFFNRDLLSNAGLASPPTEWTGFQKQVKKLTKLDPTGAIITSGAALGTATNIDRSTDILSLLMMQNGTPMTDATGTVTFDRYPQATANRQLPPGAEALVFYTDFANPTKEDYSWNPTMPTSLNAFINGQVAFFLGYAYDLPLIRARNPQLDFGVSAFPQIKDNTPIYFANYWLNAVSKKTKTPDEAWDFLQFMSRSTQAKLYLTATKKPAALTSLLTAQLEDLDLATFATQAPAAKAWYHGADAGIMEKALSDMITDTLSGTDPRKAITQAAAKVNQTIK